MSKIAQIKKQISSEAPVIQAVDPSAYLTQAPEQYTAVTVIKVGDTWVLRQIDIIDGEIKQVFDSKPNARAVVLEYLKMAVADIFMRER